MCIRDRLRVVIDTGRTHQIRVHMAWLGHPLAGDTLYGTDGMRLPRHALHCAEMDFPHPESGELMRFACPLPDDMAAQMCIRDSTVSGEWLCVSAVAVTLVPR